MHCKACEIVIKESAEEIEAINSAKASNAKGELHVTTKNGANLDLTLNQLNKKIESLGYTASLTKFSEDVNYKSLLIPFSAALAFFALFILLQKSGILTLYSPNNISVVAVFVIGVIASLSSCMAVVGGLVLSMSATFAKNDTKKPFIPITAFHASRVISFFLLGGLIGLLGSVLKVSQTGNMLLTFVLFFVMLVLGLNMLDTFPFVKKLQLALPHSKGLKGRLREDHILTPIILGALTFILPCGFTQSMQFYALSSGSFITGATTMLVFSLGTLPVLAGVSFASVKFSEGKHKATFFKTMGFLVIFFALINLISALTLAGIIDPILGF